MSQKNLGTSAHSSNQPIMWQKHNAKHYADTGPGFQLLFTSNIRIKEWKCDLCGFDHGMVVITRWVGFSIKLVFI